MKKSLFLYIFFILLSRIYCFSAAPLDVRITNITNNTFAISWVTLSSCTGYIKYGSSPSNISNVVYDFRGSSYTGSTHYVICGEEQFLESETTYYIDIVSNDIIYNNGGNHYICTTGKIISSPPTPGNNLYGMVFKDANVAPGTIMYLYLRNPDNTVSQVVSYVVEDSGWWVINAGSIRTQDLQNYFQLETGCTGVVFCQGGIDGWNELETGIENLSPAPDIFLQNYETGDLNLDRGVDISDVILLLRMAIQLDEPVVAIGDMNEDSVIDISDVILLLRKAIGLSDEG